MTISIILLNQTKALLLEILHFFSTYWWNVLTSIALKRFPLSVTQAVPIFKDLRFVSFTSYSFSVNNCRISVKTSVKFLPNMIYFLKATNSEKVEMFFFWICLPSHSRKSVSNGWVFMWKNVQHSLSSSSQQSFRVGQSVQEPKCYCV